MFLSTNEAALIIAILSDCTVEESFERLLKPDARFNLGEVDYTDISNLVKHGVQFSEIALIYNRKENNIRYSYYRVIEKYNLYDPRPKTRKEIESDDMLLIKFMVDKERSIDFIASKFTQYSKSLINDVCKEQYA